MLENKEAADLKKSRQVTEVEDQNDCQRCGTCCQKGGPALHLEDLQKVEGGQILLKYLFTIRAGEPAYDNIRGITQTTNSDIIKVKTKAGSSACIFYNPTNSTCDIYEKRPLECRLLKCWDTTAIEANYNRNRLSRRDLMARITGLWELVMDHQQRCSFVRLARMAASIENGTISEQAADVILEMIRFDDSLRSLIPIKSGMDKEILEFLLGRPMSALVPILGIRVDSNRSKLRIFTTPWGFTSGYQDQIEKP